MSYLLHTLIIIVQFRIVYSANISGAQSHLGPGLGGCGEKAAGRGPSLPGQEPSPEASGHLTPGEQSPLWIYRPGVPASLGDSERPSSLTPSQYSGLSCFLCRHRIQGNNIKKKYHQLKNTKRCLPISRPHMEYARNKFCRKWLMATTVKIPD